MWVFVLVRGRSCELIGQELRMRMGSKKIYHIEAFIAKIMS